MRRLFLRIGVACWLASTFGAWGCSSSSHSTLAMSSSPTLPATASTSLPSTVQAADPPVPTNHQPGGCNVVRASSQTATPGISEQDFKTSGGAQATRIIFLNRNGGTYYPGNGYDNSSANQSSLLTDTVTLPAYTRSDADWQAMLALAQQTYAPFNVTVTDRDPGAAAHVEVVIGGNPTMVGQPASAAGASPLTADCSVIERAVVFAFDDLLQGPDDQARVVAHEVGHAFGLDHELYCPDLMSDLLDCAWPKHFEDVTASCGDYENRACNCGGSQDSQQRLFAVLGKNTGSDTDADAGSPSADDGGATSTQGSLEIALVSPDDGASLTANAEIALAAKITGGNATKVLLEWAMPSGNVEMDCDDPPINATCDKKDDTVIFSFIAGTGSRGWSVHAIDASGATSTSDERTLTLVDATSTLPFVTVNSPSADGTFNPGDTVSLRAFASAPAGISQVWLTWTAPSGSTDYPLTSLGGAAWGLDVSISDSAVSGPRDLTVTAYDPQNQAGSSVVEISVQ